MKNRYLVIILSFLFTSIFPQNKLAYPIIFVHGLAGSDQTFLPTMNYLKDQCLLGDINVFDVVLNADNDEENSILSEDVKWEDFIYSGTEINIGRRTYAADEADYMDGWTNSNLFAINFEEERIRGAAGTFNDYFDFGNQSAIFKQGYALGKMIKEVLEFTHSDKVILVGHSMGGLAIREYLQRTDINAHHLNWVNPDTINGHAVARVVTIGTPHLGSNTGFDPTKAAVPDQNTEALRDMRWAYDSLPGCASEDPKGIYIYGGSEDCLIPSDGSDPPFFNNDVNCNGQFNDQIVGICEDTYDNPNMLLPTNIKYTWITSIWSEWNSLVGDGAVNIDRQWLNSGGIPAPVGVTDTLMTNLIHTSEGGSYYDIIRGLDVPKDFGLAYNLKLDSNYIEWITLQQNVGILDEDMFLVNTEGLDYLNISLDNLGSGIGLIEVFNDAKQIIYSDEFFSLPYSCFLNCTQTNKVYIKISGVANAKTFRTYYSIKVSSSEIGIDNPTLESLKFYYNDGKISFNKLIYGHVNIYNLAGELDFQTIMNGENKTDIINLKKGIYIIKIQSKNRNFRPEKILIQ